MSGSIHPFLQKKIDVDDGLRRSEKHSYASNVFLSFDILTEKGRLAGDFSFVLQKKSMAKQLGAAVVARGYMVCEPYRCPP